MADTTDQTEKLDTNNADTQAPKADDLASLAAGGASPGAAPDSEAPAGAAPSPFQPTDTDTAGTSGASDPSASGTAGAQGGPDGAGAQASAAGGDLPLSTDGQAGATEPASPAVSDNNTGDTSAPKPVDATLPQSGEATTSADSTATSAADGAPGTAATSAAPADASEGAASGDPTASAASSSPAAAATADQDAPKPDATSDGKPADDDKGTPIFSHPEPAETPCVIDVRTGEPLPEEHQPEGYVAPSQQAGLDASSGSDYSDDDGDSNLDSMLGKLKHSLVNEFRAAKDAFRGMEQHVEKILKRLQG